MTHTPGPWVIESKVYVCGGECCIAVTETYSAIQKLSPAQREANARLIAAAPELLNALEDFVILYQQGQLVLEGDEDGNDPLVALAIKAITKAKGLKTYKVSLREDKGDTALTLLFYCMADDPDHADEQALNDYPNGELINTIESRAEEHPYKVHPSNIEPDVFIDITASVLSKGEQP